ncbi:hypothetical protein KSS87_016737 [Heliosperma pusillum]|nr:hypothetical protein KSS87_016737 [Heliosperma pusillum]
MGRPPHDLPSSTPKTTTTTTTIAATITRLKREEFRRTKHDTAFSKWRILIGPSDWENYQAQKDGAERYRISNLPELAGPGLYEIGAAVCNTGSGRDIEKLDSERIVVVYLGQADNVRSRLQHYGRTGSHLVFGVDLFHQVFSRGFPIVYRWALMKSKSEAERTEADLLEKFDYAWNKLGNGSRRPDDILNKIDMISSKTHHIPKIWKLLQTLNDQKVGIPIKAEKLSLDNKPDHDTRIYDEKLGLFDRVFKFSRSRPRSVVPDPETIVQDFNETVICGVTSSNGKVCIKPPVEGRKRCAEHKGMKLTCKPVIKDLGTNNLEQENSPSNVINNVICGVKLHEGSHCERPPLPGRKRCMEHKGMRVNQAVFKDSTPKSLITVSLSNSGLVDCCGVLSGDGKCCTRMPVKGRKRCEEHKGMRVDACESKLSVRNKWFNANLE